ncbi:ankyrin repeat domain-containing protein 34B [Tachyglossus aculeatus]|uniref:ankyrin repeat domain-containing protein 34B n=1 Tax=Tachyglossus aculeatus TaxID=9261 RepID=UPI0018F39071|nr:ankyrin repeat domain-containing protein 34B [Tachyglossus aculeatus]XP_038621581.1 ankyrin repeat domain-containing protein 34B [Tachyglossus aculeatus]XP_038621582.1 ankyrin repeat domain-containing protein 34B [Tachyglossus aculeatus]
MEEALEISKDGNSLIKAVYQSRLRLTRLLLEGGAYINESNDRGETPLMVACKTKHVDPQGVSKAKMVKYLLENNADPNIQDKSGKTALMHACLEKAGPEVAALLVKSGADLSLQDHSGSSALVYAVNAEQRETLRVLLNACQAKGKEVIIIITAKSPSGKQTTRQYLNVPPLDADGGPPPAACTTPSEIDVKTSLSPLPDPPGTERAAFGFGDLDPSGSGDASGPAAGAHPGTKPAQVSRLHSEPWIKNSPSLLPQHKVASLPEELRDISPEEEFSFRINGLPLSKRYITRHQSIDVKDTAQLLKSFDQASSRKLSYEEISAQSLYAEGHQPCGEIPADQDPDPVQTLFVSTLRSIVQKRSLGANHYSSDSQLTAGPTPATVEDGRTVAGKKKILSPSPLLLSGATELPENLPPAPGSRRNPSILERRGSGAFPLEHCVPTCIPTRPGFLPPLNVNPHPPNADISAYSKVSGLLSCGQKALVPIVPSFPKDFKSKKMLIRRQSLQTEQIKQLVHF